MASIRLIRRRIRSAQNIAQITKAMQMVSASKMKKAIAAAEMGKLYAEKIYQITRELALRTDEGFHPLLAKGNPEGKTLVILISTNKGLCGGLNTSLFRQILQWFPSVSDNHFVTIGKKGEAFCVRSGRKLTADFSAMVPFIGNVPSVTQLLVDNFLNGTYKEVFIAFNSFVNAIKQLPVKKQILPLAGLAEPGKTESEQLAFTEFLIEPSTDEVLTSLLPHYLENQLRSAILEAEASEHSARMMAMKNATDAALDFVSGLTLQLNKARQEKITYEIADIVTARLAVE